MIYNIGSICGDKGPESGYWVLYNRAWFGVNIATKRSAVMRSITCQLKALLLIGGSNIYDKSRHRFE